MTPEALRSVLKKHHLVHDYLCSCDGPDTEFNGWDFVDDWIDHVIAVEFPPPLEMHDG